MRAGVCVCVHVYERTRVLVCVCTRVSAHVCRHVCAFACEHVCVRVVFTEQDVDGKVTRAGTGARALETGCPLQWDRPGR